MLSKVAKPGLMSRARAWAVSEEGIFTTHFWGPVANWGFVLAGMADAQKEPDLISPKMTGVLSVYSILFMRFAWRVQPRNYLLLACHFSNECVQLYNLQRWYGWYVAEGGQEKKKAPALEGKPE
ncbi:hypothetical protein BSKO_13105 [Bryopsis sp. KO-2023]|nr:hypothetical protein BSKO_13105 [Bryopsis sp. KO-2023]